VPLMGALVIRVVITLFIHRVQVAVLSVAIFSDCTANRHCTITERPSDATRASRVIMAASPIAGGLDVTRSKIREMVSVSPPSIAARAGAPATAPPSETVVLPSLSRMYSNVCKSPASAATTKASRQDASEIDGLRRLFFTLWRSSSETLTRAKTASVGLAALSADTVDVLLLYCQQAAKHPPNLFPRGDEFVECDMRGFVYLLLQMLLVLLLP
jgi:hypothetical protein